MSIMRSNLPVMALTVGLVGACVAGASSFTIPNQFRSHAVLTFRLPAESQASTALIETSRRVLSRNALEGILARTNVYRSEHTLRSTEDLVERLKTKINSARSGTTHCTSRSTIPIPVSLSR